ncbi:MAG: tandem-95 repeat protein, partial [Gammaproteobacteria bacterium]|nr:tandem-95 repeat protein [Gammaproteobacteria bacterium]
NTMIANSNGGFTNANLNHAAIIVTDTLNNTLVIDAITSQYVYTQNAAFTNSNNNPVILTYTYQLKDGDGSTNSAQLTITVADDIPIATEKLNTANETLLFVNGTETASGNLITDNSGFGISKLGSDGGTVSQVNGISAVAGIIIAPTTYGSITVYTTDQGSFVKGDYVYSLDSAKTSPVNDALGQVIDTISYQLMDGDGSTSSADLNVTVTLNQPPVANNDVGTTEQAVSLNVAAAGVLINDTVSAGDTKIVSAVNGVLADVGAKVTLSSGALLTLNSDGSYIYDPNGNFLGGGTDSFAYTMSEAEGLTSSANVTITITAPHATNDAGSTKYNAVLTVNAASGLLSNDTKSSADNILLVGVVNGSAANVGGQLVLSSGALLTVNSDGGYSYDPNGQFNLGGTDSFTYQAADGVGSLSNIATVALTIISDTAPVANDDVGSTHVGTPLSVAAPGILANDTDVDVGTTLSVVSVNGSALNVNTQITLASGALLTVNSDGSYNYDANGKFASTGTDNFTYTASDGVLNSSANVTITVLVPPVVFDLNGNGIELISAEDSPAVWLFSSGYHRTGWVSPEDGILVYDAKGNGQINDISAFAFTAFAPGANSDLEALSIAFDTNHDGIFDIHDAHYAQFGIWQDKNSNGIMDNGEYLTLAERGIISLSLTSDHQVLSLNGNNIYGFTTYQMQDGTTHLAADVGLKIGERLSIQDILHEKAEIDFSTLLPQQYSSMQVEESASVAEQSIVLPCEMNFIPHLEEQLTFA